MGLQGYVGNAHDVARIRKQEKQREEERKRFEELKKQSDANVDKAGLRQFGTAQSEVGPNTPRMCSTTVHTNSLALATRAGVGECIQGGNHWPGDTGGVCGKAQDTGRQARGGGYQAQT